MSTLGTPVARRPRNAGGAAGPPARRPNVQCHYWMTVIRSAFGGAIGADAEELAAR